MVKSTDLNDLYLFAQAIEAKGFSAAARKLDIPKATISRRIARLEERLGVQLIARNTHQFTPTTAGEVYYQHCARLSIEAELARRSIEQFGSEPQGVVKFSCPIEILDIYVADMLTEFMHQYPKVSVQLLSINRPVDIVGEQQDFAIRAKTFPLPDSDLIIKRLYRNCWIPVAAPTLISQPLDDPDQLHDYPTLNHLMDEQALWRFYHSKYGVREFIHAPRLATRDLSLIKKSALDGLGVAMLPHSMVMNALTDGRLIYALGNGWRGDEDTVHAAYLSRSGMLPSVKLLIDFLADKFAKLNSPEPYQ